MLKLSASTLVAQFLLLVCLHEKFLALLSLKSPDLYEAIDNSDVFMISIPLCRKVYKFKK